jgi:hypothetical protein
VRDGMRADDIKLLYVTLVSIKYHELNHEKVNVS